MLDDLKYIHHRDGQDALGIAEKQWLQLKQSYKVELSEIQSVNNVVLAGMGGSALPGVFLQSWPQVAVPFEICRNYQAPKYVNEETLFISSSYSGNTEETLAALAEAESKNAQIVVIAAGGKLGDIAEKKNYPYFKIPSGIQPRMSAFYFLSAFVELFEQLHLVEQGKKNELLKAADWLESHISTWRPDVATKANLAKQTAEQLAGKAIIIYSGPLLFPAANKWKICMNENAKNLAWCNQYPEFNHNEMIGWTSHPTEKLYGVVEIRSNLENPRIQKRFEVAERLLSGRRPAPIVIKPEGETLLEQLLWSANLGDFVSIYLALLNNLDPTPVDLVEKFKTELDK